MTEFLRFVFLSVSWRVTQIREPLSIVCVHPSEIRLSRTGIAIIDLGEGGMGYFLGICVCVCVCLFWQALVSSNSVFCVGVLAHLCV